MRQSVFRANEIQSIKDHVIFATVTTYTNATSFASTDLIGLQDDALVGWYVYCYWDNAGASGDPQGEVRKLITDFDSGLGTVTHNAFGTNLAALDKVMIISPFWHEVLSIRGGTETLESIDDELDAMFDYAKNNSTVTLDGNEQDAYDTTGTLPFHVKGVWIGMENMLAADSIVVKVYNDWDDASIADQISDNALWTWGGVQVPTWVYKNIDKMPLYEFKITVERIAGANTPDIYFIVDDGIRGS